MSFATFSDELSVFDNEEPYNLLSGIKVIDRPNTYGNITWSGDAAWLVVTPSTEPLAIYRLENRNLTDFKYVNVKNVKSATFPNWTNRDLIFGLETGEIRVWNVKDKRISGNINVVSKESINFLTCNLDDTCVASGSLMSNRIGLHSLKTNKYLRSLELPEGELTSSLKFCQCKKGYLAASTSASTIIVWDVITSDIVYESRNSHLGACSGLEFSPVNFSVLATVSLSHQFKMYDLRTRGRIFDIHLQEPLHCVDMFEQGDRVAVGTSSGNVIIYDLRTSKIFTSIKAHNSVVNAISINKFEKIKKFNNDDFDSPDTPIVANRTLDLSVMDVFSPVIRDSSNHSSLNAPTPAASSSFRFSLTQCQIQNDSFLSKMLSPKPTLLMSSPILNTPSANSKSSGGTPNGRLMTVLEEEALGAAGTPSDGTEEDMENVQGEMIRIQKELEHHFKLLSEQLSAMEEVFIRKVQTDYDTLIELLLNIIQRNMEKGFFEMKYELVTQRIVSTEFFNRLAEKTDNISSVLEELVQQVSSLVNICSNS